ncbi:transglutaminase-like domain-containing protein, partial [Streptomyces cinnamoneus]|uniref:transglutaminase-like domain-containing protein n=1 Tax=Streptomyces cinnamoneus TaxID=53446 RepID=UPI0023D8F271
QVTAGSANAYQQAVKLQDWFSTGGGFRYDTEVRSGSGPDAIARFLEEKRGFCIHFSFSMAAMARTLGIPARVAVGFTPGSPQTEVRCPSGPRTRTPGPSCTSRAPAGRASSPPEPWHPARVHDRADSRRSRPRCAERAARPPDRPADGPSVDDGCTGRQKKLEGSRAPRSRRAAVPPAAVPRRPS